MKSRVRMIVVLVCVFVVLPVVGGLVYLSRISAGRVQLSVYPSFCLKGLMHDE